MKKLGYKIRRLLIENVKRIKMVEVIPKDDVVEITGKNAQGKSSILDSIIYVLGGKSEIPGEPIRKGEKKAKIILETDDFTATRVWTSNDKSYLTVAANTGKSPQHFLDEKINKLSFDPVSFMNMKPTEQETLLREATGLDTTELEADRLREYDKRRDVGREVERLKVFKNELGQPIFDLPDEEESAQDIIDKIANIGKATDKRNQMVTKIATMTGAISNFDEGIKIKEEQFTQIRKELIELREQKGITEIAQVNMQKEVETTIVGDAVPLRGDLLVIEEKNKKIRLNQQINKIGNEYDDKQAKYDSHTGNIGLIDEKIADKIRNTEFPIGGLTVGEEGIIYNGIALEQASQAEQIMVGLGIAESLNSELQIILIKEGSLLDKESMKFVREYAKLKDLQIWVERIDPTGENAIIIEDGGVVTK